MGTLIFLVIFPLVIAVLAAVLPDAIYNLRRIIGVIAALVMSIIPIYLLVTYLDAGPAYFKLENPLIDICMLVVELFIAGLVVYISIRAKRYLPVLLVTVQSAIMFSFELTSGRGIQIEHSLFVDKFSIIMALIIGIIGSAICLYAIGYMTEYHEHYKELKNRRRSFFFMMYTFLAAMFGLVFSNNLLWVFFFWELTSILSPLLIGYRNDTPSIEALFRTLNMNLIGGVAFAIGIVFLYSSSHVMELDKMLHLNKSYVLLPAVCLALAGLEKSAQFPFSSWLTAAMVAPTPVSALLHSATMVKAGVYIILRVAPALVNTVAANMLMLVGGITFLVTALIAISQSNAKKVLAYSTISNLGLIVACAGVNNDTALWSALLLIIFHAVSKPLLFLCVGIVQYKFDSIDIEDMDYLIMRLPKLTAAMVIGMAGMFLAPFGMIIAKFGTLIAFIDKNPGMAIILAYGTAATVYFWTKWMGKVMTIKYGVTQYDEHLVSRWEKFSLALLAIATVAVSLAFPFISSRLVDPYVQTVFGKFPVIGTFNELIIFVMLVSLLIILPLGLIYYSYINKDYIRVGLYLGGANVDDIHFEGAMDQKQTADLKNYYLTKYFGEDVLVNIGVIISLTLIFIMFGVSVL